MATFSDAIFEAAGRSNLDRLGCYATFTPSGGVAGSPIKIWFDGEINFQQQGFDGYFWQKAFILEALIVDLGKDPSKGDAFTVGPEFPTAQGVYTVDSQEENDGMYVTMTTIKDS